MPKMDGAETLDRIKEEYPDFDTPVVLLTADIMNNIKERMLERGFADFIAKPVSSARLYETICRFIPDKIVSIDTEEEEGLTVYEVESFQDMLMPYGINIKTAIENNAGDVVEFLKRAALFEEYADDSMERIREGSKDEEYYIQMHSTKSAARGIGAYLLAELAETIELRKDDDFTRQTNPVLLEEIERVRKGIEKLSEEMEQKQR
jgi:CheY-like chemotaxis protein